MEFPAEYIEEELYFALFNSPKWFVNISCLLK